MSKSTNTHCQNCVEFLQYSSDFSEFFLVTRWPSINLTAAKENIYSMFTLRLSLISKFTISCDFVIYFNLLNYNYYCDSLYFSEHLYIYIYITYIYIYIYVIPGQLIKGVNDGLGNTTSSALLHFSR